MKNSARHRVMDPRHQAKNLSPSVKIQHLSPPAEGEESGIAANVGEPGLRSLCDPPCHLKRGETSSPCVGHASLTHVPKVP